MLSFVYQAMPSRVIFGVGCLEKLPEEVQSDISMVVLLTPAETKRSLANLEFEDPSPSLIK